jgi:glycosyltransferase involved in cell wall biosynthesis
MDAETTVVTIDATADRLSRALEAYRQTQRAIENTDPDVVLLDCFEVSGAIVTYLTERADVPLVPRLVGDTWRGYSNAIPDSIESLADLRRAALYQASLGLDRAIFRRAAGFVSVSSELQSVISDRTGLPTDRVGCVPVPVTQDLYGRGDATDARERLGVQEPTVLLTVTNLDFDAKRRGVETIVSELSELLAAREDLAYVVAGDGRYHESLVATLNATLDDQSVRSRIYTPGYVDAVEDLYALADIFVYVSYRDGYPNAVLEAQTAALPVVANAAHGMQEQITDGETGRLVDPGTAGDLRAAVTSLLDDSTERRRLGSQARERVERENTPSAVGPQLDEALATVLAGVRADDSTTP